MKHIRWAVIGVVLCLCPGHGLLAATQQAEQIPLTPLATVKHSIDQIVEVLRDPAFSAADQKQAQRDKIKEIAYPMFDFKEISRRAVGPKWQSFTIDEKTRFTDVFAKFLANTYVDRIQGEYQNEQVVYVNELVKAPLALVRTKLVRQSVSMPLDYRLRQTDGQWKIYDILVEDGVSLVKNYRVQFQSFLQKESPARLIETLLSKLNP
ncbi:MAG: ABC transporter substrate-binding protein [Desulfatitalea sp.]|nr:ABC transporter substrate-binding protein [Desulfatitalea sp.]NNK01507.1 ABC transporter substrate-binding protein [Desulfatitalea sp.]